MTPSGNLRRELVETIANAKAKKTCADCSKRYGLTFDHLPERGLKKFDIGGVSFLYRKLPTIKALKHEIAKCELVCRPCHDVRERARIVWRVLRTIWWLGVAPISPGEASGLAEAFYVFRQALVSKARADRKAAKVPKVRVLTPKQEKNLEDFAMGVARANAYLIARSRA